jgi:hypothetical protein
MILRLATMHENGFVRAKSFTFNGTCRYFHGSEESCTAPVGPEEYRARFLAALGMTVLVNR